jgi:hypothetical protein
MFDTVANRHDEFRTSASLQAAAALAAPMVAEGREAVAIACWDRYGPWLAWYFIEQ